MIFSQFFQTLAYKIESKKNIRTSEKQFSAKRKEILDYYSGNTSDDPDIVKAICYLGKNPLQTFCSDFTKAYPWKKIKVFTDDLRGLPYVMHEGNRLYFVRSYRKRTIQYAYSRLLAEQDQASPHAYLGEGFEIKDGDVLFDVGSAEGILSLHHIERLKKVVLFESDPQWVEALEATFEPWKEKVTIIGKYVSNLDDEHHITLDHYLSTSKVVPSFIKIDVEGFEKMVLEGMSKIMDIPDLRISICTYHQEKDYSILSDILKGKGFSCQPSRGWMLFLNDLESLRPPYFRKGLIRSRKSKES